MAEHKEATVRNIPPEIVTNFHRKPSNGAIHPQHLISLVGCAYVFRTHSIHRTHHAMPGDLRSDLTVAPLRAWPCRGVARAH